MKSFLRVLSFLFVLSLSVQTFAAIAVAEVRPGIAAPESIQQASVKDFDEVWLRVRNSFYDPKFRGLDWEAIGQKYRSEVLKPGGDLAKIINRMLAELGVSHTGYYTPKETAFFDLADIFAGGLRRELPKYFPNGEPAYAGIGIWTTSIDGKYFVKGIFEGYPAADAKLLVGDELVAVDGEAFKPVESFTGKAWQNLTLTIRRRAGGKTQDLMVTPKRLRPNEMYLKAMEEGARIIEVADRKIGYVHIWSYARYDYQQLLERLVTSGKLKDADALIWDLRDGWGGADPGYLDIFNNESPTMTLTERDGERQIVNGKWRKPVVLLINEGTRSGKEVLAYGFEKYKLGEVVGTRSSGALLAGRAYMMSNGNLLLLAVADVSIDGKRLEGVGVTPTIPVPFDIRYAEGRDPQLTRAIEVLTGTVGN